MLLDESDRALPELRRVPLPSVRHDSNLSRVGASDNPRAIHKLLYLAIRNVATTWVNSRHYWTAALTYFAQLFGDCLTPEM